MNKNELYSDNTQTYCTHHKTVEVIDDFNTQSNKGKLEDKIIITAQMYILHGVTPGTDIIIDLIRGGGIGNASREPIGLVIRQAGAGVLSHVLLSHLPET